MKTLVATVSILFSANAMANDCHGTEPFWGAKVSDKEIVLEGPSKKPLTLAVNSVSGAAGFIEDFLKVYSNNNAPVAIVTSNECSNGMSDHTFPKEIIIFTGTATLYGCCGEGVLPDSAN